MRYAIAAAVLLLLAFSGLSQPSVSSVTAKVTSEPVAPDGTEVQLDLPPVLHMRNTGGSDGPRGPGSGSGLCVFTSIEHAAKWQNVELLFGFQKWCMTKPGGGYPEKVDRYMDAISRERQAPKPQYIQVTSRDLSIVRRALESGRMISITYCYSPAKRYGGRRISHMVTLLHLDDRWACVLDNNFPRTYEWFAAEQLLDIAACGGGRYWAVILSPPGPPPPPTN